MSLTPSERIRAANTAPHNPEGDYVLYWMVAQRRPGWNFALQRAIEWAEDLAKPLIVFEPLRIAYPWASARFHRFILDGMADNEQSFADKPVTYYPYVEPVAGANKGLLQALADRACLIVSDDFPAFFLPHMLAAAAAKVHVRLELVDSNGLMPLAVADKAYPTAYAFRRYLQHQLPVHLAHFPAADPFAGKRLPPPVPIPAAIREHWPPADQASLAWGQPVLRSLAIDHHVGPTQLRGGPLAARQNLQRFLRDRLPIYAEQRNDPDADASSHLSPYLHFGHLAVHEVFAALMQQEGWSRDRLSGKATGKREGWWGAAPNAEAFLDELITWRELGYNECRQRPQTYDRYESLPEWAQATLAKHAADPRAYRYGLDDFEHGQTHAPLWNAAQRQLLREGRIHNYLRMLWGKKILEWSASPQEALAIMVELNNKYALDGRDPNSYSGIFWVLGRYDRPWGPERPIFGTIRYMSSDNTRRKVSLDAYLRRYGP